MNVKASLEKLRRLPSAVRHAGALVRAEVTGKPLLPIHMQSWPAVGPALDIQYQQGHQRGHATGHSHGVQYAKAQRMERTEDTGVLGAALHTLMQETGRTSIEFAAPLATKGPAAFGLVTTRGRDKITVAIK